MPNRSLDSKEAGSRPNLLFILVDQLRMDCLGAYGNREVKTPNIDRLAEEGVLYKNSFCPYPVCTPSRYSLLSGRYVHDHRGWTNHCTLAADVDTFPKILRDAGYKTTAVGKMHHTPTYLDVGFDGMVLAEQDGPGRWDDDYHRYLMENGLVDRLDLEDQRREFRERAPQEYWDTCGAIVSDLPERHHSTTWIGDRAVEALGTWNATENHLLMVSFIKPHHPFDPPSPWHEMYDPDGLTVLPGWTETCFEHDLQYGRGYFPHDQLSERKLRRVMAYYYATISQIDHQVGRLVAHLTEKGLYDNTLIVFTADHGEYMGCHHLLLKGGLMYDPLVKVPLIVRWPPGEYAGTVSEDLVSNVDVAPTLCRAAGCQPGPRMEGHDLRSDSAGHDVIYAESHNGAQLMARSATRKLILSSRKDAKTNLFFDLEKDPFELGSLYGEESHKDEIKEIEGRLREWGSKGSREIYVNQDEPQIRQPNVPPLDLSHREKVIEYFTRKVQESRSAGM